MISDRCHQPVRASGLALLLLLAGCAGVPSQEMSDARRAVGAARDADASQHAPSALSRASRALDGATRALRAGNYDAARELAGAARTEAMAARELAARVADIQAAIKAARRDGRAWEGARALLEEARQASRDGDTGRALAIAERARALLP